MNTGRSTLHIYKGTWAVDPAWYIRLAPVSENTGQYSMPRGIQRGVQCRFRACNNSCQARLPLQYPDCRPSDLRAHVECLPVIRSIREVWPDTPLTKYSTLGECHALIDCCRVTSGEGLAARQFEASSQPNDLAEFSSFPPVRF